MGVGGQASVSVNGIQHLSARCSRVHRIFSMISDLDSAGINSCTAVCLQVYSCQGIPIGCSDRGTTSLKEACTATHLSPMFRAYAVKYLLDLGKKSCVDSRRVDLVRSSKPRLGGKEQGPPVLVV